MSPIWDSVRTLVFEYFCDQLPVFSAVVLYVVNHISCSNDIFSAHFRYKLCDGMGARRSESQSHANFGSLFKHL